MNEATKVKTLKQLFLKEKPLRILLNIFENSQTYASQIANDTNTTYAHSEKVIAEFKKYGLITIKKKGRTKYISITEQGKNVAGDVMSIIAFKK